MSILSKPRLNQQLSSTESEVRLHSYSDIHPPPPPPGTIPQATQAETCVYNCTVLPSAATRDVQTGIDSLFVTSSSTE